MAANLKAENLTISIPNKGCNKNCPYCVSRMTGYVDADFRKMVRNVKKVITTAKSAEITSILFTGKGEPTYGSSLDMLFTLMDHFKEFPMELQTNGIILNKEPQVLDLLYLKGLDVVAVSMDSVEDFDNFEPLFKEINRLGMVSRITVNVTDILKFATVSWYITYCKVNRINQLTFRNIVKPEIIKDNVTANWIDDNVNTTDYKQILFNLNKFIRADGRLIRTLKNGMQIWDVDGIAITTSDYCIQERDDGDNLRSLVFMEDGHLYTGWGSKAAILF